MLFLGVVQFTSTARWMVGSDIMLLSLQSHMISTHLGVCPQHDIHYNELTTMEVGPVLGDVRIT